MSPRNTPWLVAIPAVIAAVAFVLLMRMPLPFPGFAAVAAGGLAALGTFALGLFAPAHWLWSDAERLRHAFGQRHGMSEARAGVALHAITTAHGRATALRAASADFTEHLKDKAETLADRLDEIAKEVFYDPETLGLHRKTLVRSELIEDTVSSHAALRARRESDANRTQLEESRTKVAQALDALQEAFDTSEARAANRLLAQVDVSSATAEALLGPRRPARTTTERTD